YRPHYLRTVSDLGMPELSRVQGLAGMIRELSSMRDAVGPSQVPFGLLQFLVRLSEEKEFTGPIKTWLGEYAAGHGNALANAQKKLDDERAVKILLVEITNNDKGEVEKYDLYVRRYDLMPLADIEYPSRSVKNWGEFRAKLLADLQHLIEYHS